MHPVAARRIIRLAFGTALCLAFSQAVGWDASFIAPVLLSFLLSVPIPAPRLRQGLKFILALILPIWLTTWLLLPVLTYQPAAGILLLIAACFWSFHYSASGGSPVMGAFLTVGLAIVAAVGSDSIDSALMLKTALTFNALIAVAFLWVSHAFFPDVPAETAGKPPPKKPPPDRSAAIRSAWRSTVIVAPVVIFFLFYAGSASYMAVMIKVASMGQQVENDNTKAVGQSLLMSTIIGGIGAIIMWNLMDAWVSLIPYALLVALGGLLMGRRVFQGQGMHPKAGIWSYAYLTMLVIIAPAVMDGASGAQAGVKFFDRMAMMGWATLYGVAAVYVFDAFWRGKAPQTVVE